MEQKGSLVTPDRLRFDFAHFQAMTPEEIAQTETLVNKEIQAALPVVTDVMNIEEAKKSGAMALFGEKYDQKVRVVSMGDFSKELCGGTHVKNTSSIMLFKIVSEAGIAAGVRRIEALTGNGVIEYYKKQETMLQEVAKVLKAQPAEITEKITHLQAEVKSLQSENESLKSKLAQGSLGDVMNQIVDVKGVKLLAAKVEGVDMNGLRDLGDQLKEKIGEGVVVLAAVNGGKVNLLAMATDAAQKAGAHAGNLIKGVAAIVGGGGGGRPNMAQAGGKNPEKADEAVKAAEYDSLEAAEADGTAFVFMGHGTSHTAKVSYSQMQTQMEQLGYDNVFIGTVEGEPEDTSCEAVIEKLKEAGYKKVILRPLMVVAGDHANNDMAGDDDDSWKSQFEASGAFDSIDTQIAGLGEIQAIQQLYVAHTQAAIDAE